MGGVLAVCDGRLLSCSSADGARHLKQTGETLRTNPADPAFQERVRQAYAELGTVKHTAQKLGVSKDTVRKVVRSE